VYTCNTCNISDLNVQGFLIVREFFEASELQPCLHAINELVDDLAKRLYRARKIDGSLLFIDYLTMFIYLETCKLQNWYIQVILLLLEICDSVIPVVFELFIYDVHCALFIVYSYVVVCKAVQHGAVTTHQGEACLSSQNEKKLFGSRALRSSYGVPSGLQGLNPRKSEKRRDEGRTLQF